MTDLNKLRSEFEAQHSDKVFKIVKFDEATNAYCLHDHLPLTEINLSALAEINYGWDLWQKAKAQAVPEWISIKDSMPEEGTEVLVHGFGHITQATRDKQFAGGFKQRNCYGWEAVYHVTHWMPKNFKLPERFCMYYTDEHPYKETLASESGAEG